MATQVFFAKSVDKDGYGKRHNNPLILLIDGHTSRWSYKGLMTLIEGGIYPYFIGSHTSAWAQPNDCGVNALYKAEYGKAVQTWRANRPFMPFDRVSFNWCCSRAMMEVNMRLASDLASWKAKCQVLKDAGSSDKPKGKPGNHVTRMYARTGWWPLKRKSENWEKAISQFSGHTATTKATNNVSECDADMTTELGPEVHIHILMYTKIE